MSVTVRLPFPPSVNTYWRSLCRRGSKFPLVYVSEQGKRYRKQVIAAILEQHGEYPKPMTARLKVVVLLTAPDRRKRDLDNYMKATLDAMTAAKVWQDDSQIDKLHIDRGGIQKPGWLDITIEKIEQPQKEFFER